MAGLQGFQQRRLVDDAATSQVDQEAALFDLSQQLGVEQVLGIGVVGQKDDGEVGPGKHLGQVLAPHHLIEMFDRARRRRHPDDVHAEGFAAQGQVVGDHAGADDHNGLGEQQGLGPAIPGLTVLVVHHLVQLARQDQHVGEGHLRHLWPVRTAA